VPVQQQPFVPRDTISATTSARGNPTSRATNISPASTPAIANIGPAAVFQPQPQPHRSPRINVSVYRLPSFITGPQPQINGGPGRIRGAAAASVFRDGGAGPMALVRRRGRAGTPGDDFIREMSE